MRISDWSSDVCSADLPAPPGAIDLLIDANAAFGTGRHETTRGCLLALQDIARRRPASRPVTPVLDMGCGSGVLAMAAAKLWPCRVLAVDNDAPSIPVAAENLKANCVADSGRSGGTTIDI